MPARKKRTILFVTANPVNREPVNTDEEQREIEAALIAANQGKLYQFKPVTAARIGDLRRAIVRSRPVIIHFSGHGEEGGIYLEDARRQAKQVTAEALRDFLSEFSSVECIVLNACYTDEQAAIIAGQVQYVVGMRAEIGADAALSFATAFYEMLGSGEQYERAFSVAEKSLGMEGFLDVAKPILRLRPTGAAISLPSTSPGAELPSQPPAQPTPLPLPVPVPSPVPLPAAVPLPTPTSLLNLRELDWVVIPGTDSFMMGSDRARDPLARDVEMPLSAIEIPTFAITKYPITNSQYEQFVMASGYRPPEHFKNGRVVPGSENLPVVNVSWRDAISYCRWRSRATSEKVWLPSEAQWEKAARGGDGRIWPWGNAVPTADHCNFGNHVGDITPVSLYPLGASPYGVMDMAGNAREWTNTRWGTDPLEVQYTNPYNPADGRENRDPAPNMCRVLRGGAYGVTAGDVRCAARAAAPIDLGVAYGGFRVVKASD